MSLFSKRQRAVVPANVTAELASYGQAMIDSRRTARPMSDPRFQWDWSGPVVMALTGENKDGVIGELYRAAIGARQRDQATFGAYSLLADFDGDLADQRFLELRDASLEYLRSLGLSSGHLNRYEADRWIATHGDLRSSFDRIVEVAVPSAGNAPEAKPLGPGESRMIALTAPLPDGNAFYAEHRLDGTYIVFSERPHSSDDPTRVRCDESHLGSFNELPDLLRAVGDMFGTPCYWSDDDLDPYFPRQRRR